MRESCRTVTMCTIVITSFDGECSESSPRLTSAAADHPVPADSFSIASTFSTRGYTLKMDPLSYSHSLYFRDCQSLFVCWFVCLFCCCFVCLFVFCFFSVHHGGHVGSNCKTGRNPDRTRVQKMLKSHSGKIIYCFHIDHILSVTCAYLKQMDAAVPW